MSFIAGLLLTIINIVWIALFARVIISWLLAAGVRNEIVLRINYALAVITEPIIAPLRRIIPPIGMFDISILAAFVILAIIRSAISRALG